MVKVNEARAVGPVEAKEAPIRWHSLDLAVEATIELADGLWPTHVLRLAQVRWLAVRG